ncbi:hypothetical protein [Akkermansia glycaniphila]|uniref:Anti-bacteriophage protein A/HamA C-terminal domain-containing protein n=1 Tax=Akkermansia glycaniphila TaxID=1679444 RepID=A0A1H6MF09_9BACT|nr:hypothetical protein [Akkermansia glycaniphila]SEH97581.1 Hypothetical protein PYTT_2226 [Akkermansia glycaniphila]
MNIISHDLQQQKTGDDLFNFRDVNIHRICVKIDDIENHVDRITHSIQNTSWINALDPISQTSFRAASKKTIEKLIEIFSQQDEPVSSELGEYIISISAGDVLEDKLQHKKLPISELWKEKKSGNHGFDFHTITPENKVSFGEAKYGRSSNKHHDSFDQIIDFIANDKHKIDYVLLKEFINEETKNNMSQHKNCFCATFSIINENSFNRLMSNESVRSKINRIIPDSEEIFIIGIAICHSKQS